MYKRIAAGSAMGFISFWLLYEKVWLALVGTAVFAVYQMFDRKSIRRERDGKSREEFLDFLICLEPLLKTTGTFPGAFETAVRDYRKFHGNDSLGTHLNEAVRGFRMNMPTREVLGMLSKRMGIEEAGSFSDSIAVCEASGGDTVEITGRTVNLLISKIRVMRDIRSSLSGKVLEQRIITAMPFVLLLIFSFSSGSYMEPLYKDEKGFLVMTAAGLIFLLQWFIGRKIMDFGV